MLPIEKQLDILHDHYKETFQRIREAEQSRDRLFLWVVGLFTLLALQIGYPSEFSKSMRSAAVFSADLNFSALPLAAVLSASWILTLAINLRYCQTSVLIRRQYPYLHLLEEFISPHLGGGNIYRREGRVYLEQYHVLLNIAWITYAVVFPLTAIFSTISLLYLEHARLSYPRGHLILDSVIGLFLILILFVYRVQPYLAEWWQSRTNSSGQS